MRSVYDAINVERAIDPISITGIGTPTASAVQVIDTFGFNSAVFEIAVGTATGTATAITVDAKVQESATSTGTFADVSGATMTQYTITSGTATGVHAQIRVEGLGTSRLRYLKLVVTLGGTPTDKVVPIAAVCLLGRAFKEPVSNSSTAAA